MFRADLRKLTPAFFFIWLLLSVSICVHAAEVNWGGNTLAENGSLWSNGNNWVGATTPTSSDNAVIDFTTLVPGGLFPDVASANTIGDLSLRSGNITLSANLAVLGNVLANGNVNLQDDLDIGGDFMGNATTFAVSSGSNVQLDGDLNLIIGGGTFPEKLVFTGTQQSFEPSGATYEFIELRSSGNVTLQSNLTTFDMDIFSGNLDLGSNDVRINSNMNVDGTLNILGGNLNLLGLAASTYRNLTIEAGSTLKMTAGSNLMVQSLSFEAGSTFIGEGVFGITVLGDLSIQTNNWDFGSGNLVLLGAGSSYNFNGVGFHDLTLGPQIDLAFSGTNLLVQNNLYISNGSSIEFQDTPLTVGGNLTNANLLIFDGAQPIIVQTMDNTQGTIKFDKNSGGNIDIRPVNGNDPTFELYDLVILNGPYASSTNLSIGNTLIMNAGATLSASNINFDMADPWSTSGTLEVENGYLTTSSLGNVNFNLVSGANLTIRNSVFTGTGGGALDSLLGTDADLLVENTNITATNNIVFGSASAISYTTGTLGASIFSLTGGSSANLIDVETTLSANLYIDGGSSFYTSLANISVGTHYDLLSSMGGHDTGTWTIGGNLLFSSSTATSTSSNTNVSGETTLTSSTFTHNSGNLVVSGNMFMSGTSTYSHGLGDWSVAGNLESLASTITQSLGNVLISGESSLTSTNMTTMSSNLYFSGNSSFITSSQLNHTSGNILVMGNLQFTSSSTSVISSENVWVKGTFELDASTLTSSTNFLRIDGTGTVTGAAASLTTSSNQVSITDEAFVLEGASWSATGGEMTLSNNLNVTSTGAASSVSISSSNLELTGDLLQDTGEFSFLSGGNANFASNISAIDNSTLTISSANSTVSENIHVDSSTINTTSITLNVTGNVGLATTSGWTSTSDSLTVTDMIGLTGTSTADFVGTGATLSTNQLIVSADSTLQSETGMTITMSDSISELNLSNSSYVHHLNVNSGISTVMSTNVTFKGNLVVDGSLNQNGQDIYLDSGNMSLGSASSLTNSANLFVTGTAFYGDARSLATLNDIGYVDIDASANLTLTDSMYLASGNLVNRGMFVVGGETLSDIGGSLDNSGTIALHGDVNFPDPSSGIVDRGTFLFTEGAASPVTLGVFTPETYKNLTLAANATYYINTTLTVTGTLTFMNGANLFIADGKSLIFENGFLGSYDDIINEGEIILQGGTGYTISGVTSDFGDLKINQASTTVTVSSDLSVDLLTLGTGSSLTISSGTNLAVTGNAINIFAGATIGSGAGSNLIFTGNTTYTNNGTSSLENIWVQSGSNLSLLTDIEANNQIWVDVGGILTTFDGATDYGITSATLDNDGTIFTYEMGTVSTTMYTDAGLVWMSGTNGPYSIGSPWFSSFYELKMSDDWATSSDLSFTSGFTSDMPLQITISSDNTLTLLSSNVTLTDNILLASSGANLNAMGGLVTFASNIIVGEGSMFSLNHVSISSQGNITSLGNSSLMVAGNFHVLALGNWTEGMSTLTLGGAGNLYVPNESFYELSLNGSDLVFEDILTVSTNLNAINGHLQWRSDSASVGNVIVYAGGNFSLLGGNLNVGTDLQSIGVGAVTAGNLILGEDLVVQGSWEHVAGNLSIGGNAQLTGGTLTLGNVEPDIASSLNVIMAQEASFNVSDNLSLLLTIPDGDLNHSGGDLTFPNGAWFGGNYTWLSGGGNFGVSGGDNLTIDTTSTFNLGNGGNLVIVDGVAFYLLGDLIAQPGSNISIGTLTISSGNTQFNGTTILQDVVITGGNVSVSGDTTSIADITISGDGNLIIEEGVKVDLRNLTLSGGNVQLSSASNLTLSGNLQITGGAFTVADNSILAFSNSASFESSLAMTDVGILSVSGDALTLDLAYLSSNSLLIGTSGNLIQGSNTLVVTESANIETGGWLWNASGNLNLQTAMLDFSTGSNLLHGGSFDLTLYQGTVDGRLAVTSSNLNVTGTLMSSSSANISGMDLLPLGGNWSSAGELAFGNLIVTSSTLTNSGTLVLSGGAWIDASSNLHQSAGLLSVTGSVNVSGGIFDLDDSTPDLTGLDLIVHSDAMVELSDNFSNNLLLIGGSVVQESGNLNLLGDFSIPGNVTVLGDTTWNLPSGSNVTVEIGGNLIVGATGNLALSSGVDYIQLGDVLINGGRISMDNIIFNGSDTDLGNFTGLSVGNVIVRSGEVTIATGDSSINQLTVESTGDLVIPMGANLTVTDGFLISGDLNMDADSTLVLEGGDLLNANGSSVNPLGNVIIDGTVNQQGDLDFENLTVAAGATYDIALNTVIVQGNVFVEQTGTFIGSGTVATVSVDYLHRVNGFYNLQGGATIVGSLSVGTNATYGSNTDINGSNASVTFAGTMNDGYMLKILTNATMDLAGSRTTPVTNGIDIELDVATTANLINDSVAVSLGDVTLGTDSVFYVSAPLTISDTFENGGNVVLGSNALVVNNMDTNSGTVVFGQGSLGLGGSDSPPSYYNLEMNLDASDVDVAMMSNVTIWGDLLSSSKTDTDLVSSGYDLMLYGAIIERNLSSSSNLGVSGCVVMQGSGNLSGDLYVGKFFASTSSSEIGPWTLGANLHIDQEILINGSVAGNISLDFSGAGLTVVLGSAASANLEYVEFNNVSFSDRTFAYNSRQVDSTNLVTEYVELIPASETDFQGVFIVGYTEVFMPGEALPDIDFYRTDAGGNVIGSAVIGTFSSNSFAWSTNQHGDDLGSVYLGAFTSSNPPESLAETVIGPFTLDNHLNLLASATNPRFNPDTSTLDFEFDHPVDGVDVSLISLDGPLATSLTNRVVSTSGLGTTQPSLVLDNLGVVAIVSAGNIILESGAFTWNGNTLFSTNTNTFATSADTLPPEQLTWTLDFNTRTLEIEFNEPVVLTASSTNITIGDGGLQSHVIGSSSTLSIDSTAVPANVHVALASEDRLALEAFGAANYDSWTLSLPDDFVEDLFSQGYLNASGTRGGNVIGLSSANLANAILSGDLTAGEVVNFLFDDSASGDYTRQEQMEYAESLWAAAEINNPISGNTIDGNTWFATYYATNSTLPVAALTDPTFDVMGIPTDATFTVLSTPLQTSELPTGVTAVSDLLSFNLFKQGSSDPYDKAFSITVVFKNLTQAPEKFRMYSFDPSNGTSRLSIHPVSDAGNDQIAVTFTSFSEYILVFEDVVSPFASGGGGGGGCLLSPESGEDQPR